VGQRTKTRDKMAYGPDTDILLERIELIPRVKWVLDIEGLNITHLPDLPEGLRLLSCIGTPIKELPPLPSTLWELLCSKTQLTSLPALPPALRLLNCSDTPLTELPELPPKLAVSELQRYSCRDAARPSRLLAASDVCEHQDHHPP